MVEVYLLMFGFTSGYLFQFVADDAECSISNKDLAVSVLAYCGAVILWPLFWVWVVIDKFQGRHDQKFRDEI